MEYYKTEKDDLVAVPDQVHKFICEFYSYLSDNNDHDAAATTNYLDNIFNIAIDHAVGAPGHDKDVVDGLDAVYKAYLNKMVFRTYNPGSKHTAEDIMAHLCTPIKKISYA
eukprot:14070297-Ditylum_brightwellii.AAC.1